MPEMGVETFRRIRAIDPVARVLVSSGYAGTDAWRFFSPRAPQAFSRSRIDSAPSPRRSGRRSAADPEA
jgi:hypothetical protein